MVTRQELIVRGNQPQQITPSQSKHTEILTGVDGRFLDIPVQPREEYQPHSVTNIYINGDYHHSIESARFAAREARKHRRDLDREAREDRRERAADRSARIELGMFAGYMLTLIIIVGVIGLCTFALTAMGMFHH